MKQDREMIVKKPCAMVEECRGGRMKTETPAGCGQGQGLWRQREQAGRGLLYSRYVASARKEHLRRGKRTARKNFMRRF